MTGSSRRWLGPVALTIGVRAAFSAAAFVLVGLLAALRLRDR